MYMYATYETSVTAQYTCGHATDDTQHMKDSITSNDVVAYESFTYSIFSLTIRASLATWEERSASNTFW